MSRINRIPYGLQDLVGNTAAGENPDVLENSVRPALNIEPYWDATQLRFIQVNRTVTGPTASAFILVPNGEAWIPLHIGASIDGFAAGATCAMSTRLYESASDTDGIPLAWTEIRTFTAPPEELCLGYSWPQRELVNSGRSFSVNADVFTGVSSIMKARLLYVRLKV